MLLSDDLESSDKALEKGLRQPYHELRVWKPHIGWNDDSENLFHHRANRGKFRDNGGFGI